MTSKHLRGGSKVGGFSLIELMISITIGLIILSGMLLVFANTNAARNEIDRTNRQIENGRYALEVLRDDIQLAGFYGEMNWGNFIAPSNTAAALPSAMPDACATALTERTGGAAGVIRLHVQGINDFTGASTALDSCPAIKSAVTPRTDVIVVRRAKTCFAGVGDCDSLAVLNGKPALQVSLCSSPPATASNSKTHALGLEPDTNEFKHKLKNCTTDAPKRPYVNYMYFVGTYNGKANVLMRAELRLNGTATDMTNVLPLVDGIENLQVEYGVDNNNDGNADTYESDLGDPTLPATVTKWSNVVTVKIHLLARNTEGSPNYIDTKSYTLGAVTVPAANDNIRRHVYTSLVRIQNVSGRRETP